jgi:hypothetical protein
MTIELNARFENGVFVPEGKVALAEHQRVTLVVKEEVAPVAAPAEERWWDDPNDPMPAGGMALLEWWDRHRLQGLDPETMDRIARGKEYDILGELEDDS